MLIVNLRFIFLVFVTYLPNRRQKKSRRKGRDGEVLGVGLAEKLKGEGVKNPARRPGAG